MIIWIEFLILNFTEHWIQPIHQQTNSLQEFGWIVSEGWVKSLANFCSCTLPVNVREPPVKRQINSVGEFVCWWIDLYPENDWRSTDVYYKNTLWKHTISQYSSWKSKHILVTGRHHNFPAFSIDDDEFLMVFLTRL